MKYATRFAVALAASGALSTIAMAEGLRERVLRDAALDAGLVPAKQLFVEQPEDLVDVGKLLFESRLLSLNNDTACASCHLDRFGSTDGLPNAIGTEGEGFGPARVLNGGDIVPRNVLPFLGPRRHWVRRAVLGWKGRWRLWQIDQSVWYRNTINRPIGRRRSSTACRDRRNGN